MACERGNLNLHFPPLFVRRLLACVSGVCPNECVSILYGYVAWSTSTAEE